MRCVRCRASRTMTDTACERSPGAFTRPSCSISAYTMISASGVRSSCDTLDVKSSRIAARSCARRVRM